MSGHIERLRHRTQALGELLGLTDTELLALAGSSARADLVAAWEAFDPVRALAEVMDVGLAALCLHDCSYPRRLLDAPGPPFCVYGAGADAGWPAAFEGPVVAVVGARRATDYGLEVARSLGHGLAAAGVTVLSGLALGIDSAAHEGALEAGGRTAAVLAGGAERPYPASRRALYQRVRGSGGVLSETPPGHAAQRWSFLARNRVVAALAEVVVVVEADEYSGSLVTASRAREMGRTLAAVPGPVTSPQSRGTLALLRDGARLVRHTEDVLDALGGLHQLSGGLHQLSIAAPRESLTLRLQSLLDRVAAGDDTVAKLIADGLPAEEVMAGLAELELLDRVCRGLGGRYTPTL